MEAAARLTTPEALKPPRLRGRRIIRFSESDPDSVWGNVLGFRPLGGRVRAVRRMATILLWTLVAVPIQAVLLALPGHLHIGFGRFYFRTLAWLMGLKVQVVGEQARGGGVLFVSNHSSWLDIVALGAALDASFVAKREVGEWPVVRTIARLGRTVFVSRTRTGTKGEAGLIRDRLSAGDNIILFPEGTTSDGGRVLPFRSAFLSVADSARTVQPVSVVYDRLGGLPACRRDRPLFAWYGDMDLGSHFWRLARRAKSRATIVLHDPLDPKEWPDRKALTAACAEVVAESCATLRQNRPVAPLSPSAATNPKLRA
ncbi:1-acyl-sn-glycerol-3-phosphate acyltransferase [Roseomonas sp. AR75]|uniref:lysophospholipid acyltransferase family protein n=1 Tax=Roseomonas sp. AR75 TaxID=2562311 RepID=UPI0010C04998|nr:lysophospholipid acyltransferase family protein [Roseomonas sp. AR75]